MKKLLLAFSLVICTFVMQAQDYKITFSLTGEINEIDSVIVENATQQTSVKLNGTDTLVLTKVVSSIHQIEKNKSLQLQAFPNPSATYFTFQFSTNEAAPVFATVYDLSGRKMISKKWDADPGDHSFQLKNLPTGIFLIQLNTDQYSDKMKIISTRNSGTLPEITSFQTKQKTNVTFPTKSATSAQLLGYEEYDNITIRVWPSDPFITRGTITQGIVMNEEEPPLENEQSTFVFEYVKCEDACGNVYNTVELGDQVWMAENFRCATENSWVYNGDENNAEIYGRLYTWEDALNNAPDGWHLPSNEEWNKMQEYVQNTYEDNLPVALKSKTGWNTDDNQNSTNGTDATGFNMVPGGARWFLDGTFYAAGERAYFWTSTEYDSERATMRKFTSSDTEIGQGASNVGYGFSVRYIKDKADYGTFTDDRDGETYKTITIGEQTWMAENLRYDLRRNPTKAEAWQDSHGYCWYDDDINNKNLYGALYSQTTALGVCPSGWHLPSDEEWQELEDYLINNEYGHGGHESYIAKAMAATTRWKDSNEWGSPGNGSGNNNTTGFSALPGGRRSMWGGDLDLGKLAMWWTFTRWDTGIPNDIDAWYRELSYDYEKLLRSHIDIEYGLSVRCIKD